jgi:gamma-glutamyltranspeptidase/glutathione hydrolase
MTPPPQGRRPNISSVHGLVASAHPLASQVGIRILDRGGNAFDAAVAVAAALGVVEPFMSGPAGIGFATMWVAQEARVRVLDFVPPVPHSFPFERFTTREQLARGPLSISLPGNLAGWCELSSRYGTLPLETLFSPAAALAEDGFALAEYGAWEINHELPKIDLFANLKPLWQKTYPFTDGVGVGQMVRQPELGKTLRDLGRHGPTYFYDGPLGEQIVRHIADMGGSMTEQDLRSVQAVWREPATARYRGLTIHVPPPPSEAFQFLLTMRLLECFDVSALERNGPDHIGLVIRAVRLAASVRIMRNNPSTADLSDILSDGHVKQLARRLREPAPITGPTEQWTAEAPKGGDPAHTTSFSIADRSGNMICVTQSLGTAFGSLVVVPGTGITLNNFLYWADVQPDSPNRTAPGASLPMCLSPSISTRDGRPVLALGTPGSYGIMQTQPQAMLQYIDFGLSLQQAIEAPRARVRDGNVVEVEDRIPADTIAALCARGHDISAFPDSWTMWVGGMQAIARDPETGLMTGAADPRRDGYAIGL